MGRRIREWQLPHATAFASRGARPVKTVCARQATHWRSHGPSPKAQTGEGAGRPQNKTRPHRPRATDQTAKTHPPTHDRPDPTETRRHETATTKATSRGPARHQGPDEGGQGAGTRKNDEGKPDGPTPRKPTDKARKESQGKKLAYTALPIPEPPLICARGCLHTHVSVAAAAVRGFMYVATCAGLLLFWRL